MSIVHGFRLLSCNDGAVNDLTWAFLRSTVKRKIGRTPSMDDIADYLSGNCTGDLSRDGGDIGNIWTRVRKATLYANATTPVKWVWNNTRNEIELHLNNGDETIKIPPSAKSHACRLLRSSFRQQFLNRLLKKPDQGKVLQVSSLCPDSNHMLKNGNYTRFADWRFIHRARLDCVPLNGSSRFGDRDKRCRRCGYQLETLPHVLNHCRPTMVARTHRHDAILNRLVRAVPKRVGTVRINQCIAECTSTLRPDLVITNPTERTIRIVDVAMGARRTGYGMNLDQRSKKPTREPSSILTLISVIPLNFQKTSF